MATGGAVVVLAGRGAGTARRVTRAAAITAVVVGPVALLVEVPHLLEYHFPPSFYVWGAIPVFASVLAATWPRRAGRHAAVAVGAVLGSFLFPLALINQHYAYAPSLPAVLGRTARDEATFRRLAAIRTRVGATMALPRRGVVVRVSVPAVASGFSARRASVYLPPAWFADPRPSLPAVILLSGTPGTPVDWTRSAFADVTADDYAAAHDGVAPILVMPDPLGEPLADTECVDAPHRHAETYVVRDVVAAMATTFGVSRDGHAWAIAGSSAGGTCAMTIALRHPDQFRAFADFSGDAMPNLGSVRHTVRELFGGSWEDFEAHDPARLLASARYAGTGAWFEVGTRDAGPLAAARSLAPLAAAAGADVCFVQRAGGHDFRFWRTSFEHALPWLVATLEEDAAGAAGSCPASG